MKTYEATEQAYKNGYEKGRKDAVKHGRWKGAGMGDYYCSLCQRLVNPRTNYCPHCGAKMDGDGNG